MSRRRFYAPPESFAPDGGAVELSVEESRHLREVLRLHSGDEAFVFDGAGREFKCVVIDTGRRGADRARLDVRGVVDPSKPESPLELTLGVGLLKGEKFDLVVQKVTEVGVSRIAPVMTRRSDIRPRDSSDAARRVERWRRVALEACKQSGRARVPVLDEPLMLDLFTAANVGSEMRLMFTEHGGVSISDVVAAKTKPRSIVALIGPEGGWDTEEIALAKEQGWTILTLGGRTLRAETAAIVSIILLQHLFGDLR